MPFSWFAERRRAKILATPFPEAWEATLRRDVTFWRYLDDEERTQLRELIQVFIAEKHWEGCGGLELTDPMRVTIAAGACLLLLGRDHALFDDVQSILVYPNTVVPPERPLSFFSRGGEIVHGPSPLAGEAWQGGPVILVWDAVKRGARHAEDGHNVVFHEFAHKIDMLDGGADGTPPLADRATRRTWAEVCAEIYLALKDEDPAVRRVLDPYGATHEAEFFAVATESFFERPEALAGALPALYQLLADFYQQDPRARMERSPRAD